MKEFLSYDHEMNPEQLHDAMAVSARGAASAVVMFGALIASNSERFNPALQTIGLVAGLVVTTLTGVNLCLTLKERWKKSRRSRRH